MSLAAILRAVEAEAAAEAEATLSSAREQAERLVADAQAAADARVAEALSAAEPGFAAEAVRVVNVARLRLLRRRAELGTASFEAAWQEARQRLDRLAAMDGMRWRSALRRITTEALEMAGPGASVALPSVEVPLVEALAAERHATLEALPADAPPGPVVRSADGRIEIDATLPTRLGRARVMLAEDVAGALGVGG